VQRPEARFIMSAARPDQFPPPDLPEVAFLGRSNVGKSTLLNALAGIGKLAHTSATPGRTQTINFFRVGDRWCFVDLPGYGYAKAPPEVVRQWKPLVDSYLGHREGLQLCLLLLDSRRGWMEKDLELSQWLDLHDRRYLVVATKFDKLNRKQQHKALDGIRKHGPAAGPVPFSAVTGQGVREIWQAISKTPQ
jgi:GTP-binding protein